MGLLLADVIRGWVREAGKGLRFRERFVEAVAEWYFPKRWVLVLAVACVIISWTVWHAQITRAIAQDNDLIRFLRL